MFEVESRAGFAAHEATNASRIVNNPAFVDKLNPAELEGTLAQEVLHCALGHHCRRGERDPELWNEAADLAINPILLGNGFTFPAGALIDLALNSLSAEDAHAWLLRRRSEGSNAASKQSPHKTNAGGGIGNGPQGTEGGTDSSPSQTDCSHQPASNHGDNKKALSHPKTLRTKPNSAQFTQSLALRSSPAAY